MAQMLCYNCANSLDPGIRFCTQCGAEVRTYSPSPENRTQVYGGVPLSSQEQFYPPSPATETVASLQESPHPQWQSTDARASLPPPPPVVSVFDPLGESVLPPPALTTPRRSALLLIISVVTTLAVAGVVTWLIKSRANKPPFVQSILATPVSVHIGDKVTLTAQAGDPNNDPLIYRWSDAEGRPLGEGPAIIYDTSHIDASSPASIQIQLTVNDQHGGTATASQNIIVLPTVATTLPHTLPMVVTLDSDQRSLRVGESVNFTAQVLNRDPSELTFDWKTTAGALQTNGHTASLQTAGVQVSGNARQVAVAVTVSDTRGATQSVSQMVSVVSNTPANWPPSLRLRASRLTVQQGEEVEIAADASDRDGDALSYSWRSSSGQLVGGNTRVKLRTGSSDIGAVEVTATVTDARGETVSQTVTINVVPHPNHPPLIATLTPSGARVRQGTTVYFRSRASDPDDDALSYSWESSAGMIRGNGSTATLDTSAISGDNVTVTLTVSDARGGTAHESTTIALIREPQPSPGIADPPGVETPRSSSLRPPGPLHGLLQREDADSFVVTVQGRPGTPQSSSDAIEIVVQPDGSVYTRGYLPAAIATITFGPKENIREPALVEPPGPGNGYGRLRVRLRPKSKDKPMRVIVYWTRQ